MANGLDMGTVIGLIKALGGSGGGIASTWVGTAEQYAALAPDYDPDTLYFIRE